MKLSTRARYAVMAMVDLAVYQHHGPVSLPDIAERQGLPLPYLEQLFSRLRKKGLVVSARGAHGGFSLARLDNETCILDVINAVESPVKITRCEEQSRVGCQLKGTRCLTHDLWAGLGTVMRVFLGQVTLKDVYEGKITEARRLDIYASSPHTQQVQ